MKRSAILSAIAVSVLSQSVLFAGAEEASKYIEEAAEKVKSQSWDEAKLNLELAETEAADMAGADKAKITDKIASLRNQIVAAQSAALKPRLLRQLQSSIDDAKPQIGNAMFDGFIKQAEEILADKNNVAILGADAEKFQKQIATFRKLHAIKFAEGQIVAGLEDLEATKKLYAEKMADLQNPELGSGTKGSAVEELERKFAEWDAWWPLVPAADPRVVTMKKAIDEMKTKFAEVALADRVNEVVENLKRMWELYKDEWEGNEAETSIDWETYRNTGGNEKINGYGAPQSINLVERYARFLENRVEDEKYQSVKDAPAIKAYMESLAKANKAARDRVIASVKIVVTGAEAVPITSRNIGEFNRLEDSLRVLFTNSSGAQDGDAAMFHQKIVAKIKAFEDATEGAAQAREASYKAHSAAATAKWDEISKNFSTEAGFDPNNSGAFKDKLIRFETDNLMGWRFKPGDFAFASTINGIPVACVYSTDVKNAVATIEKKLGRSLGDNDADGRWTVIAKVTGRTGRMLQKKQAEGDAVDRGGNAVGKYTVQYADPVDAPILEIVAAKCGPLAVGQDVGMAREDGTIGSP